jgi:hypothetical protein
MMAMSMSFLDMATTEFSQDALILRLMNSVIEMATPEVCFKLVLLIKTGANH